MRIIVLEWFECPRCGVLIAPDSEAHLELLRDGFCKEFWTLTCIDCRDR